MHLVAQSVADGPEPAAVPPVQVVQRHGSSAQLLEQPQERRVVERPAPPARKHQPGRRDPGRVRLKPFVWPLRRRLDPPGCRGPPRPSGTHPAHA